MNSAISYAMHGDRISNYNVSESYSSDHLGMGFHRTPHAQDHSVFSENFYLDEMAHAGIQQSQAPKVFRNSLGASVAPDVYASERPYGKSQFGDSYYAKSNEFAIADSVPSIVHPNAHFSSNLFDKSPNGSGSITAPSSTNVTPRSSGAPWEMPELKLQQQDFFKEHRARDQVNREYTSRDQSPLSGRQLKSSFSQEKPASRLDFHRLSQSLLSLQLGDSRLMDPFVMPDTLTPLSSGRSSIWSTGKPNQPISLENQGRNFLDFGSLSTVSPVPLVSAPSLSITPSQNGSQQKYNAQPQAPYSVQAPELARADHLFQNTRPFQRNQTSPKSAQRQVMPEIVLHEPSPLKPSSRKLSDGSTKSEIKRRKPMLSSSVTIDFGVLEEEPVPALDAAQLGQNASFAKNCSSYILRSCPLKEHREDFCSTFYKRNTHGYMFIRESSNSLKVNTSGPKSWVTLKIKLGDAEQRKLNVDSKRLPVWKPINLNQPHTSRRAPKKRRPFKKTTNRRR